MYGAYYGCGTYLDISFLDTKWQARSCDLTQAIFFVRIFEESCLCEQSCNLTSETNIRQFIAELTLEACGKVTENRMSPDQIPSSIISLFRASRDKQHTQKLRTSTPQLLERLVLNEFLKIFRPSSQA